MTHYGDAAEIELVSRAPDGELIVSEDIGEVLEELEGKLVRILIEELPQSVYRGPDS